MAVMNAMQIQQYGTPDVFVYEEVQRPVPGAGEVLVRVRGRYQFGRYWYEGWIFDWFDG